MTQAVVAEAEVVLTHREAVLLLKTIPLDATKADLKGDQYAAIQHYLGCGECQQAGLAALLGVPQMACKEAIELWLLRSMHSSPFMDELSPSTLKQQLAIEHVFGRQLLEDPAKLPYRFCNRFGGCQEHVCARIGELVSSLPPGTERFVGYHRVALRLFRDAGWDLSALVAGECKLLEHELEVGKAAGLAKAEARLAIAAIGAIALSADHEKGGAKRTMLPLALIEPFLLHAIMHGTCPSAGTNPSCGWTAHDRDCGVGCIFAASLVATMQQFARENMTGE